MPVREGLPSTGAHMEGNGMKYTIGGFPAIIKATCSDGSVIYDCSIGFDDLADYMKSLHAIRRIQRSGQPLSDGRVIEQVEEIIGLEAVTAALTAAGHEIEQKKAEK
jgi:hypothetical protein